MTSLKGTMILQAKHVVKKIYKYIFVMLTPPPMFSPEEIPHVCHFIAPRKRGGL
jgi:hypothetical protein